MAEAAAQLQKGLDQLALLPDDPKRQRKELEFCIALGAVLQAIKGYAAPKTGRAYARARELWEQLVPQSVHPETVKSSFLDHHNLYRMRQGVLRPCPRAPADRATRRHRRPP